MSVSKPAAPISPSPVIFILSPIPRRASPATAKAAKIANTDRMVFAEPRSSSKSPKRTFTASLVTLIEEEDETKWASELQLGANSPRATSPTNQEEEAVVHPLHRHPVSTKVKHSRILRRNSMPELRKDLLRLDPATLAKARLFAEASKTNSPTQE